MCTLWRCRSTPSLPGITFQGFQLIVQVKWKRVRGHFRTAYSHIGNRVDLRVGLSYLLYIEDGLSYFPIEMQLVLQPPCNILFFYSH